MDREVKGKGDNMVSVKRDVRVATEPPDVQARRIASLGQQIWLEYELSQRLSDEEKLTFNTLAMRNHVGELADWVREFQQYAANCPAPLLDEESAMAAG